MIGFVVLTHRNPDQATRLAKRLRPHRVFLHVDTGANEADWRGFRAIPECSDNVELLARYRSAWASWELVKATLTGLDRAVASGCSHVVVMTGQDYPLRPVVEIAAFFAGEREGSWVPRYRVPVEWLGDQDGGLSRFTHWNVGIKGMRVRVPLRRKIPDQVVPHYGQAQCVLSAPMARWVLDEVSHHPGIVKFFRRTWAPDELFFTSLSATAPMASSVHTDNLWYTDWSAASSHPKTFTLVDAERLLAVAHGTAEELQAGQVKLFARKFDTAIDASVLDVIDKSLLLSANPDT